MAKPDITEPTVERVVSHKVFRYYLERPDPIRPDQVVTVQRLARRGDKVLLREIDSRRGDAAGAFFTKEQLKAAEAGTEPGSSPAPTPAEESSPDLTELDEGQIQAWLDGELDGFSKPSIPQVLAAVSAVEDDDDKEVVAEAVKDAEEKSSHDTRASLVKKLDVIVDDDDDDDDVPDYSEWDKERLNAELEKRGLSKSGNLPQKAARLRDDDKED